MPVEASALFGESSENPIITADSVEVAPPPAVRLPVGLDTMHSIEPDAPTDHLAYYTTGRVPGARGLDPEPRPDLPGNDYGIMALLMAVIIFLTVNCRHYDTFFKTFFSDLLKVRERDSIFNDHTLSETRITVAMIIALCLSEAILIYAAVGHAFNHQFNIFIIIAAITLIAGVYYLWQLAAYATVGYLFTARWLSRQWLRGFNASQTLLGITLLIPAIRVLFRPEYTAIFLTIAASLYFLARIIFICKGFKVFYQNSFSLIYFILYLCTLEIAPLLLICRGVGFISKLTNL